MNAKSKEKLLRVFENLFNPIDNKDYGLYWLVSHNKSKPLANAEDLLRYIRRERPEGSFINRYANLTNDLILENNIFLDFDLTNNSYLKEEESLTLTVLEQLEKEELNVNESDNYTVKNNKATLKQIQDKYNKSYTIENGFIKGYSSFIDSLTLAEEGALATVVKDKEKEEVKGLSEKEVQRYYINKFEKGYLKEPFKEATTVANYFESIGVKTVLNLSGSKGFALRIPITTIDFSDVPDLAENPENVKLFLLTMAELIETKILKKPKGKSSIDYAVFKKGMQRIPTSKHNKTKLYANFIDSSFKYLEAIDVLEEKVPSYIPELVNTEKNTETLLESDIYKATIKLATEEATKTFKSEEANPNYKFKGEHEELLNIISKVYLPSVRNEVGFRIVHLLRRSNFSQEEVENIFKQLHEDLSDYNSTIKGSIVHAYKTEKLVGLRSLIKWLNDNASSEVKEEVVGYFKKKFNYFEAPEETILEDKLNIDNDSYKVIFHKTKTGEKYIVPEFLGKDYNLEIHPKQYLQILKKEKPIAKLVLANNPTIRSKSKNSIKPFEKKLENKEGLTVNMEEVIEELDLIISYFIYQQEQEEELEKQAEEISVDIEDEANFINFHFYGNDETYIQTPKGIYEQLTDNKGEIFFKPVANVVIKEIAIILDSLGILEPVYNVTYYNRTFKKEVTVEYLTEKQLTEEFIKAKVFNKATKEAVNYVLNSFIIEGANYGLIETKTESYLEGYFYINNKVVSNTKLDKIKNPTKKELAEAINLLNEIMKDRTEEGKANDSAVYRFMLWNPFSYVLKQLGYSKANYSLILIGKSQTNKTGATNIGRLFYLHDEEETSGSTVSVLGSKIGENSYLSVFDECSHLFKLPEALNVMKRLVYEFTARATKDRTDNTKIDVFNALGLAMFILNEDEEFKDFITNRYKIIYYSGNSYISDSAIATFNKKYVPESKETVLKKLAYIGKVFSNKIIKIIEDPEKRTKLFNIEETTIEILKEIQQEAGVEFNKAMLKPTEASTKFNYDVKEAIVTFLNSEFKKRIKKHDNYFIGSDFIQSAKNSNFNFLIYNPDNQKFLIKYSNFTKFVNSGLKDVHLELNEILEYLELDKLLEAEAKANGKQYLNYIKKGNRIGSKNHLGFYLDVTTLASKVFNIQLTEETEEESTLATSESS